MKIKYFLTTATAAFTLSSTAWAGGEGWTQDFSGARKTAADGKKDLLVDFTGSDWCSWCIKLNKEVFDHDEFRTGVKDSFVLVELDYPRDKSKLSEETQKQNETLIKTYPIKGYPTILLCDSEGKPFAQTGYQAGGPEKYVTHLNELRGHKATRDAAFAKAAEAKGVDQAKAYIAALDAMELAEELIQKSYPEITKQIIAADPKDETGFAKKASAKEQMMTFMQKVGEFQQKSDLPGALAYMDATLADKTIPQEFNQNIHGHKAALMLHMKKPAEAVAVLEEGIAVAPKSETAGKLTQFLEIARKQKAEAEAAADKPKDSAAKDESAGKEKKKSAE